MADRHGAAKPGHDPHAGHDLELVSAHAADDARGADASRAAALVDSCVECRAIADDLRIIRDATRALGSAVGAAAPSAPRDFRLTPVDAERLARGRRMGLGHRERGRPWWTRLGTGLVAVGLGVLVLSAAPLDLLGGIGGTGGAAFGTKVNQDATAPLGPAQAEGASSTVGAAPTAAPERTVDSNAPAGDRDGTDRLPFVAVGGLALVLGIAVLLASRAGRRAGP